MRLKPGWSVAVFNSKNEIMVYQLQRLWK